MGQRQSVFKPEIRLYLHFTLYMKFWRERHNNLVRPHRRECMVAAKFGPDLRLVSLKKAGGNW